ncbi:hypothetical protein DACRYDRAFT_49862 [Dacryopinax primogenitus]|uniref:Uncharacterized protein n=1 Tax=Dacryopinax primogenitus (strain DJM 731) TaxID=1858805 RepID=M5G4C8_DACPD|nr:uncharacterized protein DACRYDRAFT_49862 [Dacryopinax primogenitus]EJU03549.1 hypothetical protein DACRYDRAFT_49862 [Dacryopinax primogenitus]
MADADAEGNAGQDAPDQGKGKGKEGESATAGGEKQVRFSSGIKHEEHERKPGTSTGTGSVGKGKPIPVDGVIGKMELFADGRVRIVLGEDIALEVHPAAETAFLETLVHLDPQTRELTALGQVERRFVVAPDVDVLLRELEGREIKREAEGVIKLE